MKQPAIALLVVSFVTALGHAQDVPLLRRRYVENDRFEYLMKGQNNNSTYEVRLTATVKKNADGRWVDENSFSELVSNGKPRPVSETAQAFRIPMSLDGGGAPFLPPDLSKAPGLIGPVTDLMNFYADLFLAIHQGALRRPGDRFQFSSDVNGSWADGTVVLVGESAVDFDVSLMSVDDARGIAVLRINHVPPRELKIKVGADWMRTPVADTPNNHVQVRKTKEGYQASVGKETFDVEMQVALTDGKILSASIHNPVTKFTRDCVDAALTECGESRPDPVLRRIEMSIIRH